MENKLKLLLPLIDSLCRWNLEEFLEEIVDTIYGCNSVPVRIAHGIAGWTSVQLISWLSSLACLKEDRRSLMSYIKQEEFDGETFQILITRHSDSFSSSSSYLPSLLDVVKVNYTSYFILSTIFRHWKQPLLLSSSDFIDLRLLTRPLGVFMGRVSDLSSLSKDEAKALVKANKGCEEEGIGCCYGQFMTLGFTEYRMNDKKWTSFGFPNNKFVLRRR
jgi:hypothetical protein